MPGGRQRNCRSSVVVICVIKLLKTKFRIQVPTWWGAGACPVEPGGAAHGNAVWERLGVSGFTGRWAFKVVAAPL